MTDVLDETRTDYEREPNIVVTRNALTYEFGGEHSFYADLYNAARRHDLGAQLRLDRHQREHDDETRGLRKKEKARLRELESEGLELRVSPSTALGSGGEFSPPLWLTSKFSSAAAAGRVLADLVGSIVLPPGVASVNIPRIATGAVAQIQAQQGGVVPSQDETTFNASSPVVTITGDVDVSQQLFDQTPNGYDIVAFTDMGKNYSKSLDAQLMNGSGVNGQLLGLTSVVLPAGHLIDGTSAVTFTLLWPLIGRLYAAVGNDRQNPPERFLMAPRRWAWMGTSLDSSSRPIASPGTGAPSISDFPLAGNTPPSGTMLGVPFYVAGAIPAGTNSDFIVACRPSDLLLFESTPKFAIDQQVLSGTMQVRMQLRRYVAWIPQRLPSSIAIVNNLVQPSGF